MEKLVFSIVLNWNNFSDTKETIECLLKQDYSNHKIILVDNNSEKNIKRKIRLLFPDIIYIENKSNLGYTGGNNIGIKFALKNGADIIIISNNDIYIENTSLIKEFVSNFNHYDKNLSILGPRLMFFEKKDAVQESGTTFFSSPNDKYFLNNFFNRQNNLPGNLKYYDGVPGAFMVVKREVFEKSGFFDEKIFMYGDETDFCYRAWANGFYAGINTELIVYHKAPVRKVKTKPYKAYYITRNSLYFLKKHKKTINQYKYFRNKLFRGVLSKMAKYLMGYESNKDLFFATLRGFYDGIFNKMGNRF